MLKAKAIELLGGTPADAARAIGVTDQAISKWPDVLPPRIADRVVAAIARRRLPDIAQIEGEGDSQAQATPNQTH